ncbi:MAG: trigger factor [Alphaproteobacteria bacterium]|nr:trigger factor [Alphaproteobacteria bacterium]
MQVKELKQDGLNHELEITVSANDIDKRVDNRLQEVGKTVKMAGFRPGKVPMAMLKKRYGKAIMGEVLELAVDETSKKALNDRKLTPALKPKIEVKSFDDGKDLVYTLAVEVLPEFKLADFKGAKLERPVAKPDAKSVDDALENIAKNNLSSVEVKTKRGAKEGDILVIDFHGRTADDNKAHEGMHAHGHHLTLGSGQFIPGFEEQLIGAKAGEKIEVKVTFPENYGAEELAGREAIFDVDVEQIREPSEPKIDDEFAKSLGLEDVAALKKAVEEQLQKELDSHSRMNLKKALLDFLDEAHDFEVPPGMLDMEFAHIIQQLELERQRSGQDKEVPEDEKAEYREIAARRIRLGLILSEIGNRNELTVGDADLQRAVISEAQKFPGQERAVFDYYAKNPQALESLRAPLFEEKVVDFILELADVTDKSVTPEELFAALEDEDEAKPSKPKKKAAAKKPAAKASADTKAKADKPKEQGAAAKKKAPAKKKAS